MKLFKYLNEAKQVGTLYHYTSLQNLQKILETNTLKTVKSQGYNKPPVWEEFVSLTRN